MNVVLVDSLEVVVIEPHDPLHLTIHQELLVSLRVATGRVQWNVVGCHLN